MFKFERSQEDKKAYFELVANRTNKQLVVSRLLMLVVFIIGILLINTLFDETFGSSVFVVVPAVLIIGLLIDIVGRNNARKKLESMKHDAKTTN